MPTPVIFRKEFGNNVVAFFPTFPGTININTCQCYAHIGQHSIASIDYYKATKPAQPEEYKDLLEELISIGYDDLVVRKKITYKHFLEREKNLIEDFS